MKYKLTENGNIAIKDGHPVIVDDDGKESTIDALGANEKIKGLVAESNGRRKKLGAKSQELEEALEKVSTLTAKFDGIDDKNKIKVEELTSSINKIWEGKQAEWEEEKTTLNGNLFNATTGAKFATSKVAKTLVLPADIALATFGKSFKPDGTAIDSAGNVILSTTEPGKPAGFDEALTHLINEYPNKDAILKSNAEGGGGSQQGSGGGYEAEKTAKQNIKEGIAKL